MGHVPDRHRHRRRHAAGVENRTGAASCDERAGTRDIHLPGSEPAGGRRRRGWWLLALLLALMLWRWWLRACALARSPVCAGELERIRQRIATWRAIIRTAFAACLGAAAPNPDQLPRPCEVAGLTGEDWARNSSSWRWPPDSASSQIARCWRDRYRRDADCDIEGLLDAGDRPGFWRCPGGSPVLQLEWPLVLLPCRCRCWCTWLLPARSPRERGRAAGAANRRFPPRRKRRRRDPSAALAPVAARLAGVAAAGARRQPAAVARRQSSRFRSAAAT